MTTNKKSSERMKLNGPEQVAEFMNNLEHPLKEEIEEVRHIILSTDDKITEHIKWNAPSFCFEGEDRITFNLHGKGYIRLVFHCGAKVKDRMNNEPLIVDHSSILEWKAADRAIMKFTDKNDVKAKEEKLREVITMWLKVI
ncbi:DUF1801 domain-containing protein [Cytobacillus solani]|uniref:YdhG-like domain-containing protein n=1 Tax=Cytobacillus solani TaxID=1637975 RepID=A0A0Q3QNL4_9BACI|nr:DUF1801 domain-containing protein [Cytobacillus solani]KOP82730.1 hypothetical protein AMS60_09710 [Bacillus sp. FJAT-21945]KQL19745.1 hypothetical protein AN957_14985 [Cytobacillus solani]USK52978.1 DUF1801 domain-containing protein [Cytobacillus solani]